MGISPISSASIASSSLASSLGWNPFGGGSAAQHAMNNALSLGGIAASELAFERARDNISLSTSGQVYDKTVVSETTTVTVNANSAYMVDTESAAQAASDKAAGKAIASAPGADGNVNVVAADDRNRWNNTGSVSVETVVTYSDGSSAKSVAGLGPDLKSTGDGFARKRLDAIVGGATSESEILKKLGIAQPGAAATTAASAPTDVGVHAAVSADTSVTLTYVSRGDQRSVSGVESGTASALITSFDPAGATYGSDGTLSTTKESMSFAGQIRAGSLFGTNSATWLAGALEETTKSRTTIPGANQITIDRQSTLDTEFETAPNSQLFASQSSNAAQIRFAGIVSEGAAAGEEERITLAMSDSSAQLQSTDASGTTAHSSHKIGVAGVSISWTPITA